jgi:DNA-binding CsgD family transcriptional regulator
MAGEVPARIYGFLRAMVERHGRDVDAALEGLSLRTVDPASKTRVDWDDVATFMNRAYAGLSIEELERAGEDYIHTNAWIQMSVAFFATPRLLYFAIADMTRTLRIFPHLRQTVEPHETHLHLEYHLPPQFVPCPFFFRGSIGEYRQMNTLFGKPPARVEADVGPYHGIYDIFYTDPPQPLDRMVAFGRSIYEGAAAEFRRLLDVATGAPPPASPTFPVAPETVLGLQRKFGLTLAEARVAVRLAGGLRVVDIARELGSSPGTVRCHLKAAYAKTGARSQATLVRLVLGAPGGRG